MIITELQSFISSITHIDDLKMDLNWTEKTLKCMKTLVCEKHTSLLIMNDGTKTMFLLLEKQIRLLRCYCY